jgi:hypothetical protein
VQDARSRARDIVDVVEVGHVVGVHLAEPARLRFPNVIYTVRLSRRHVSPRLIFYLSQVHGVSTFRECVLSPPRNYIILWNRFCHVCLNVHVPSSQNVVR